MSKITRRLAFYFLSVLLIFSILIGIFFSQLYTHSIIEANRDLMTKNAESIAESLSTYLESNRDSVRMSRHRGMMGTYNSFLEIVDDISYGEVWLVDKDMNVISRNSHSNHDIEKYVSSEGIKLIEQTLSGESLRSEFVNEIDQTMMVSVPAYDKNQNIVASVLVFAPISSSNEAIKNGLMTLSSSVLIALILALIVSVLLSRKFIKPIQKMNKATEELAEGNYLVKTNVYQNDELGDLAQTIDVLSERLYELEAQRERLDLERTQFYVDVSHELRTPVTVLRGSVELLKDHQVNDEAKQQEYYTQMLKEIIYLQNMLNDLLDYSKLRNQDYQLKLEKINVMNVLSDSLRSIRKLAESKNITVNLESESDLLEFNGDYEKLRQLFMIVLDNALKFSKAGQSIDVLVKEGPNTFTISIKDYGEGMAEKDIPYIFDRYYSVKGQNNLEGTGIGLAIVKEIADRHHIDVEVFSELKNGTTFIFKFFTE